MTTARIVEAFDELERRDPRFGLRLEPAPVEKLALQRGEEALAHGVVVGVSDRAHRGTYAGLTAAVAELNGGILRALVGVVDHAVRRRIASAMFKASSTSAVARVVAI